MAIEWGTKLGARAQERLAAERVAWLTTVTPDGQPQSMPVWFLWRPEASGGIGELLVYSHRAAIRNRNLRTNPRVAILLPDDGLADHFVSLDAEARIDEGFAQAEANPAYLDKYGDLLARYDWTPAYFSQQYSVPILIRPTTLRGAP